VNINISILHRFIYVGLQSSQSVTVFKLKLKTFLFNLFTVQPNRAN